MSKPKTMFRVVSVRGFASRIETRKIGVYTLDEAFKLLDKVIKGGYWYDVYIETKGGNRIS